MKHNIYSYLELTTQMGKGKYVGVPFIIDRSKKAVLGFMKDKLWKRINHWLKETFILGWQGNSY